MKFSILTLLFFLSVIAANSQDVDFSFSPKVKTQGYILTLEGDSIPKLISFLNDTKILTYDLDGNKKSKETFKASKLKGFKIGSYFFEAHKYKNIDIVNASATSLATPPKYFYMSQIISGKISVLQHYYLDADGKILSKFLLKKNGEKIRTRMKLKELVSDCTEVFVKIENEKKSSH